MKTRESDKTPAPRRHDWVQERLSAYLDGALRADEQAKLQSHLATCDACAQDLETLRQTVAVLKRLPSQPLPQSFLLRANQVPSARRSSSTWLSLMFGGATAMAALLLVMVVALDLAQSTRSLRSFISVPAMSVAIAPQAPAPSPSQSSVEGTANEKPQIDGFRSKGEVAPSPSPALALSPARRDLSLASPQAAPPAEAELKKIVPAPIAPRPRGEVAQEESSGDAAAALPAPAPEALTADRLQDFAPPDLAPPSRPEAHDSDKPAAAPNLGAQIDESGDREALSITATPSLAQQPLPEPTYAAAPTAVPATIAPVVSTATSISEVTATLPVKDQRQAGPHPPESRLTWWAIEGGLLIIILVSLAGVIVVRFRARG